MVRLLPTRLRSTKTLALLCALALPLTTLAGVQDDLVKAVEAGDLAKTRKLLSAKARADAPDAEGTLPLLVAVRKGQPEMVELLLSKGADPNHAGSCGEANCMSHPAIVGAVGGENLRIVKALLAAKADVSWNEHRLTRYANMEMKSELFQLLRAAGGQYQAGPTERERGGQSAAPPPVPAASQAARLFPVPEGTKPAAPAAGKLRVAIIPDPTMQEAADLLTSELTGAGVTLLERAALQRIIDEQQLGADLTKGGSAAKLGALAGADALVFLRQIELGKAATLELRLVRTSPEVVLSTTLQAWPPTALDAWSKTTAAQLQSSLGRARREHAVAVAVGDFRTTGVEWDSRRLARDAQTVLATLLHQVPEIILLERESLAEVAREQALQGKAAFWAGSYLVDGTIEPPLTPGSELKLTLRVQPTAGGEPLTFQSQGAPDALREVVQKAVDAASKTLALQTPALADLAAEAKRHFEDSNLYLQRSMPLSAWRSLEIAGLLDPRYNRPGSKLQIGMSLIEWQLSKTDIPNVNHLKSHGWSDAWLRFCLPAGDYVGSAEFMEIALQNARNWRAELERAIAVDELTTAKFVYGQSGLAEKSSIGAAETLNTVAGHAEFGPLFAEIAREYTSGIAAVYAAAPTKPDLASLEYPSAEQLMRNGALLQLAPEALLRLKHELLAKHFATSDTVNRIRLRQAMLSPSFVARYVKTMKAPAEAAIRPALLATLRKSAAPEDQFTARLMEYDDRNPQREGKGNAELSAYAWDQRKLFVDDPATLDLYRAVEDRLTLSNDAKYRNTYPPGGGSARETEAILDLRRRLYLEIAAHSEKPSGALRLFNRDYHPANEDKAEMARLEERVRNVKPPVPGGAVGATSTPGPNAPAAFVTSFAKGPHLKVDKTWTAGGALGAEPFTQGRI